MFPYAYEIFVVLAWVLGVISLGARVASKNKIVRKVAYVGLLLTVVFVLLSVWAQKKEAQGPSKWTPQVIVQKFFEDGRMDLVHPAVNDPGVREWKIKLGKPLSGDYVTVPYVDVKTRNRYHLYPSNIILDLIKIVSENDFRVEDGGRRATLDFHGTCVVRKHYSGEKTSDLNDINPDWEDFFGKAILSKIDTLGWRIIALEFKMNEKGEYLYRTDGTMNK